MFLLKAFLPAAVVIDHPSNFKLEKTDGVGAVSDFELVVSYWRHREHFPGFRIYFSDT